MLKLEKNLKLKKGGKAAGRRKSFCSRMCGMKKKRTGAKGKRDPNSRINKALRKCHDFKNQHDTLISNIISGLSLLIIFFEPSMTWYS